MWLVIIELMHSLDVSLIFFSIYAIVAFVYLIFLFYFIVPLIRKTKNNSAQHVNIVEEGVSVIVVAKNEAKNLSLHLRKVLEQDYPNFEVVVASDHSNDNTLEVLREFEREFKNLRILDIQDWHSEGKKAALTRAVFYAQNEILLFTDADCEPSSNQWIRSMSRLYQDKIDFVLGYGGYAKTGGLLNALVRFDAAQIAALSFGFAKAGMAYMGVGRNLSYRKSLFINSKGFTEHLHLLSGDDDLFVQANATKSNVIINTELESKTISIPKKTVISWWKQKLRHQSTVKLYQPKFKFLLGLYTASKFILFLLWPLSFLFSNYILVLISFGVVLLLHFIIFRKTLCLIHEKGLSLWNPFLEVLLLLNTLFLSVFSLFYRSNKWK